MKKSLTVLCLLIFLTLSFLAGVKTVPASADAENTWATKAPMPQAVPNAEAAVVNGKIYVIGGSFNYEYDPATDNWTARSPMPTPRTYFGIAVYQNDIYTIGGWNFNYSAPSPTYYSVNEVYDTSTNTWQAKQPLPTNRTSFQANVVNGTIFVISGQTADATVTSNEAYNIANDSWTTKASIPTPVIGYSSAVCEGKIYILGGQDKYLGGSMSNEININLNQIYDPTTDSWSQGAPLPTTVIAASAGATTGEIAPENIYLFGGMPNGKIGATPLTQVYDPQSNTWMYGAPMPTARGFSSVATIDDTFYAIGGSSILDTFYVTSNEQYTPFGYGTIPPTVSVISPANLTYVGSSVPLVFSLNRQVGWMAYSLDMGGNVTVAGNSTLTGLSNGLHNVTVYVNDTFGNMVASQTVAFTVSSVESKPFSAQPVAGVAVAAVAILVVAGLLVYYMRHRHSVTSSAEPDSN